MSDVGFGRFRNRHGKESVTGFLRCGQREPLILIHGVGAQASIWAPQMHVLSERFDVIAYDLLGHGESSQPLPDARLSDYADQLLDLLDALRIQRAHLIGHSMGALIALEFALSHPKRASSLVAMNAVFCRTVEQRRAVEERAAMLDERHGTPTAMWDTTISRWFGDPVPDAWTTAAKTVRDLLSAVDPIGYARTYRVFASSDAAHRDRLGALAVPALFMTGEHDPNSTPVMSEAMAKLAPRGRALIIKAERHMMSITAPAQINGALIAFLDAITLVRNPNLNSCEETLPDCFDRMAFRKALGSFVTGVTVVTTLQDDGQPRGFTANSFTSVSLDPPLVLVCISRTASSYPVFLATSHFAVNILADTQADLSSLFASKASDKFDRAAWREGPAGSPLVEGTTAWFDCRSREVIEAGDHVILIGRVIGFDQSPVKPLGYYRGAHVNFGLSLDALAASGGRTQVGAILEHDGAIVLIAGDDGWFDLPVGMALGTATDPASLAACMRRLGLKTELDFLFAVFENPRRGPGAISIYYRGIVQELSSTDHAVHLVPFEAIPWSRLREDAVRSMLQRFVRERSEDTFGIYVGDSEHGNVHALARHSEKRTTENPLP